MELLQINILLKVLVWPLNMRSGKDYRHGHQSFMANRVETTGEKIGRGWIAGEESRSNDSPKMLVNVERSKDHNDWYPKSTEHGYLDRGL